MNLKVIKVEGWSGPSKIQDSGLSKNSPEIYTLKHLTSRQARRMSELTKITVDHSISMIDKNPVDHIIFVSRQGELYQSTSLIGMIKDNEVLSPMKFSQSVHNTSVGQLTTILKKNISTISIGVDKDYFKAGLKMVYSYLCKNPEKKVLLVLSDISVPKQFTHLLSDEENQSFVEGYIFGSDADPMGRTYDQLISLTDESYSNVKRIMRLKEFVLAV
jgi:hypothetical protein